MRFCIFAFLALTRVLRMRSEYDPPFHEKQGDSCVYRNFTSDGGRLRCDRHRFKAQEDMQVSSQLTMSYNNSADIVIGSVRRSQSVVPPSQYVGDVDGLQPFRRFACALSNAVVGDLSGFHEPEHGGYSPMANPVNIPYYVSLLSKHCSFSVMHVGRSSKDLPCLYATHTETGTIIHLTSPLKVTDKTIQGVMTEAQARVLGAFHLEANPDSYCFADFSPFKHISFTDVVFVDDTPRLTSLFHASFSLDFVRMPSLQLSDAGNFIPMSATFLPCAVAYYSRHRRLSQYYLKLVLTRHDIPTELSDKISVESKVTEVPTRKKVWVVDNYCVDMYLLHHLPSSQSGFTFVYFNGVLAGVSEAMKEYNTKCNVAIDVVWRRGFEISQHHPMSSASFQILGDKFRRANSRSTTDLQNALFLVLHATIMGGPGTNIVNMDVVEREMGGQAATISYERAVRKRAAALRFLHTYMSAGL